MNTERTEHRTSNAQRQTSNDVAASLDYFIFLKCRMQKLDKFFSHSVSSVPSFQRSMFDVKMV